MNCTAKQLENTEFAHNEKTKRVEVGDIDKTSCCRQVSTSIFIAKRNRVIGSCRTLLRNDVRKQRRCFFTRELKIDTSSFSANLAPRG